MSETDESSAQTPPQENEETFYYVRMARRDDGGSLIFPFSHYTTTSHASGSSTIRAEQDDYSFWLWLIQRERRAKLRNYVGNADLELAKREFGELFGIQAPPLAYRMAILESLQLLSEWEAERNEIERLANPLNPMNWVRMFWNGFKSARAKNGRSR